MKVPTLDAAIKKLSLDCCFLPHFMAICLMKLVILLYIRVSLFSISAIFVTHRKPACFNCRDWRVSRGDPVSRVGLCAILWPCWTAWRFCLLSYAAPCWRASFYKKKHFYLEECWARTQTVTIIRFMWLPCRSTKLSCQQHMYGIKTFEGEKKSLSLHGKKFWIRSYA